MQTTLTTITGETVSIDTIISTTPSTNGAHLILVMDGDDLVEHLVNEDVLYGSGLKISR